MPGLKFGQLHFACGLPHPGTAKIGSELRSIILDSSLTSTAQLDIVDYYMKGNLSFILCNLPRSQDWILLQLCLFLHLGTTVRCLIRRVSSDAPWTLATVWRPSVFPTTWSNAREKEAWAATGRQNQSVLWMPRITFHTVEFRARSANHLGDLQRPMTSFPDDLPAHAQICGGRQPAQVDAFENACKIATRLERAWLFEQRVKRQAGVKWSTWLTTSKVHSNSLPLLPFVNSYPPKWSIQGDGKLLRSLHFGVTSMNAFSPWS